MKRTWVAWLLVGLVLPWGCVEFSRMVAPPTPTPTTPDFSNGNSNSNANVNDDSGDIEPDDTGPDPTNDNANDADTNGTDVDTNGEDADTNGTDVDTNGEDVDSNGTDVDTNGADVDSNGTDVDTNGADVDTNGANTNGIPPLPDGAELTTTESGLQYYDFETGTGDMPAADATVRVAYTGYLPDGKIFDSNEDATFRLTNLIAGFSEGVQSMRVGGRRRLIIPPDLGYGENGNAGAGIGGEDTIVFDVNLLSIE